MSGKSAVALWRNDVITYKGHPQEPLKLQRNYKSLNYFVILNLGLATVMAAYASCLRLMGGIWTCLPRGSKGSSFGSTPGFHSKLWSYWWLLWVGLPKHPETGCDWDLFLWLLAWLLQRFSEVLACTLNACVFTPWLWFTVLLLIA